MEQFRFLFLALFPRPKTRSPSHRPPRFILLESTLPRPPVKMPPTCHTACPHLATKVRSRWPLRRQPYLEERAALAPPPRESPQEFFGAASAHRDAALRPAQPYGKGKRIYIVYSLNGAQSHVVNGPLTFRNGKKLTNKMLSKKKNLLSICRL